MRILMAVEDEKFGDAMIEFASKHEWPAGSEFKIIHLVEPMMLGSYTAIYPSPLIAEITEQNMTYGSKLVSDMKNRLQSALPTCKVYADVMTESPKYGILTQAKEWKAEMILMGSHGRRGLSRLVLGSVAEAVMSHADCSVTIVRLRDDKSTETVPSADTTKEMAAAN